MFYSNPNDRGPLAGIVYFLALIGLAAIFLGGLLLGMMVAPAFGF